MLPRPSQGVSSRSTSKRPFDPRSSTQDLRVWFFANISSMACGAIARRDSASNAATCVRMCCADSSPSVL
eukprot:scaffold89202_cov69-Phaeocystis_antarctica.AAC.12